jgi:hypothetical protein
MTVITKRLFLVLYLAEICLTISAQITTPITTRDKSVYYEKITTILTGDYTLKYDFGAGPIGHTWSMSTNKSTTTMQDHYRVLNANFAPDGNMYIYNMKVSFEVIKKSDDDAKVDIYIYDGDALSNNGTDLTAEELQKKIFLGAGTFLKTIDVTDKTQWKAISFDIPADYFRTMKEKSFSLIFKLHPCCNQTIDYTQLIDLRKPGFARTNVLPTKNCAYYYPVQGFKMGTDGVTTTLNSVPEFCLGTDPWVVYANLTLYGNCTQLSEALPLYDHRLSMTIWECNYDLSRKYSTPSLEWQQAIDRTLNSSHSTDVDWFNLKSNLPPNSDIFRPDGVYELWLWESSNPSNAAKRYFHVWTDYGNITNVPAYCVNLRQNTINITNSTIKNNYRAECVVDIAAQNSINILPGSGLSELLPNSLFRIDPTVSCSNLQNQYRIINPDGNGDLVVEEIKPELAIEKSEIYPNPTNENITVKHSKNIKQLTVYNVVGDVVLRVQNNANTQTQLDLSNLAPGLYILQIDDQDRQKIIKQ